MTTTNQTQHCHYISRFMTKPWEAEQRRLRYFDFTTDSFESSPSSRLFAEDRINSQRVEDWLNRYIETPLAAVRPRLVQGDPKALDDTRFFRAAVLMVLLQGTRGMSTDDEDARQDLEQAAARDESYVDGLVRAFTERRDLALIVTVGPGQKLAPLFFPSTGLFPLFYRDTSCLSGLAIGFGLPLDLHCALAVMPENRRQTADRSRLPSSIANLSVGLRAATRVVIPPDALGEAVLREALLDLRDWNDAYVAAVTKQRALITESFAEAGLRLAHDRSARLHCDSLLARSH